MSWLKVTQGLKMSISENPECCIACFMSSVRCLTSPLKPRATKVAPFIIADVMGLSGASTLPKGVLLVFIPMVLVGEIWPVVSP